MRGIGIGCESTRHREGMDRSGLGERWWEPQSLDISDVCLRAGNRGQLQLVGAERAWKDAMCVR